MAIYALFSWLDYAVYSMVKYIMRLIILVSNYNFFGENQIQDLADKVYVVLGVLVLFKIIISAIEYMVNPDTFDDKEKGMVGILKKTLICLALLVLIRPIFSFAITIQQTIVSTIPSLVMGTGSQNYDIGDNYAGASQQIDKIGDLVAGSTVTAFVSMKTDENGRPKSTTDPMAQDISNPNIGYLNAFSKNILDGCQNGPAISKYVVTDQCTYDYKWGISTAAGIFLLYVLTSMTIDVGIRSIKLGIIQILAPIPIGSYIVSKDKFNKFVKLAVKVYLDLFIRLIVIYFIIFFVNNVITSITSSIVIGGATKVTITNTVDILFIKIIIIAALFMFAKNAPKFICDVLGLDSGGFGDMADMFKPAWQRYGGVAGAAINPAANAIANYRQAKANGEGHVARALRALGGAGRGVADAFAGAAAGDDWKKMRQRHDAAKQRSGERSLRHVNRDKAREQNRMALENSGISNITADDILNAQKEFDKRKAKIDELKQKLATETDPDKRRELARQIRKDSREIGLGDKKAQDAFINATALQFAAERQRAADVEVLNNGINDAQKQIEQIDKEIAAGNLTQDQIAEKELQKLELEEQIEKAQGDIENITHEKAAADAQAELEAAQRNSESIDRDIQTVKEKQQAAHDETVAIEQTVTSNEKRLERINEQLTEISVNDPQYESLIEERRTVQTEIIASRESLEHAKQKEVSFNDAINTLNSDKEAATTRISEAEATVREVNDKIEAERDARVKDYTDAKEIIKTTESAIKGARLSGFNSYFGGTSPSGKGYMDLSNFLGSSRSSIYTGEAMTKMRQNADSLVDASGKPATFTTKFTSKGNEDKKFTYEQIATLKKQVDNGKADLETIRKAGFDSEAMVQSAFEDIEKSAAAAYINANILAAFPDDPALDGLRANTTVPRLKRPREVNTAVVEWWNSFEAELYKNGASKGELDRLRSDFKKNPGKFIQGGSSLKDKYATIGKRLIDSTKPDDGKK